ncbi:hypothetical protein D3C81_1985310 [compost metagenome]
MINEVTVPAEQLDLLYFFARGVARHDGGETQAKHFGEVGFGHSGAARGCLDHLGAFSDLATANGM